ncbi:MAG: alpha/beta hydrolase [Pyrinomonadaceae bacterium]|nr:alpha/beta hydrolase [Pyrinomonadaceae bacterium]
MRFSRILITVLVFTMGVLPAFAQRRSIVGDVRFHKLKSDVFGNTRTIRVLVPPGYSRKKAQRYPVLYLNDGQNLFQVRGSQSKMSEWGIDETIKDLLDSREIEPIIIVGIDNAGRSGRANEYLPYEDKYLSPPLPNPQGSKYPDFLTEEVLPFVEKNYRVKTGAEFTALGGASYGALISLFSAIKKPGVFGSLLLESPSFYVDEGRILDEVEATENMPERVYIGVGTNEEAKPNCVPGDQSHEAVQDVLKFKKILEEKELDDNNLKVLIEDCAVHNEGAYGRRFYDAMRFLYGRK